MSGGKPPRRGPPGRKPAGKPPRADAGLAARRVAAAVVHEVLRHDRALDDAFDANADAAALDRRDQGFARAIAFAAFRRRGLIGKALEARLARGLPARSGRLEAILITAAAQILVLDVPPHAVVDSAVALVRGDMYGHGYAPLANAVLRRIADEREALLAGADPLALDTPAPLAALITAAYGADQARAIATAHTVEPPLDITCLADAPGWAERLGGTLLPTGSVRLVAPGPVPALPGFDDGHWFVQDAAAALPVRLFGALEGRTALDLCCAPGGKTAQLAAAGARVTAIDRSVPRLERTEDNLRRLNLTDRVRLLAGDATLYTGEPADAVLLDAPCSASGTIRRHPEVAWIARRTDIEALTRTQDALLDAAASLTRPGGTLVYATCSLDPVEGEARIAAFLGRNALFARRPVTAAEIGGLAEAVTPAGDLRTLPCHLPATDPRAGGLDGFYAARLVRTAG